MSGANSSQTRRRVLRSLGAATAAGLAGCGGGGDGDTPTEGGGGGDTPTEGEDGMDQTPTEGGDGQELGERVPQVILEFWTTFDPGGFVQEPMAQVGKETLEALGCQVKQNSVDVTTSLGNADADTRTSHLLQWGISDQIARLNPATYLDVWDIRAAGNTELAGNWSQYVSCDYQKAFFDSKFAESQEENKDALIRALTALSEDVACIPVTSVSPAGAFRKDRINPGPIGHTISAMNVEFWLNTTPKQGDTIRASLPIAILEGSLPVVDDDVMPNHLIHSTLVHFDENFEMRPWIAKDWEVTDGATTYTFDLHEDATFHNGDPVDAEAIKWTYEMYGETEQFTNSRNQIPFTEEGVRVVDDYTVEFNLKRPFSSVWHELLFRWPILHPPTWQYYRDNPSVDPERPDELIGCGPFQVEDWNYGNSLIIGPFDGHPHVQPDHRYIFRGFRSSQSRLNAFVNGEIDINPTVQFSGVEDIKQQLGDKAQIKVSSGFTTYFYHPQMSWGPTKFEAFRKAFAQAYNRKKLNAIAYGGNGFEPTTGSFYTDAHPMVNTDELPQYTDDPSGSVEQAKQTLRDAGWGWDDNGRLHYPPDADLSPRWPKEGHPDWSEIPCMTEDGAYKYEGETYPP